MTEPINNEDKASFRSDIEASERLRACMNDMEAIVYSMNGSGVVGANLKAAWVQTFDRLKRGEQNLVNPKLTAVKEAAEEIDED